MEEKVGVGIIGCGNIARLHPGAGSGGKEDRVAARTEGLTGECLK